MELAECEKKAGLFCLEFVKQKILCEKELSLPVASDSMLPLIRPQNMVVVKTCRASDVTPGDIVLFERGSSLVVHRLLRKKIEHEEVMLVPKADRAYTEEEPFPTGQLLGKVIRINKKTITWRLDRWHGRAINKLFYSYSLLKMKVYALVSRYKRRLQSEVRKEDVLIQMCSVTTIDVQRKAAICRILSEDVNWEYFLKKVQGEDTASLLYKVLLQIDNSHGRVPFHVMNKLKDFYYAVMATNISFFKSLENIAISFQKEDIDAIVFKGLMLAESVYKDIGLRPMGDIDLLLGKGDVAKADLILRQLGIYPEFELRDYGKLSPGQYRNSLLYRSADSVPVSVHVHWHVVNFSPFHESVMRMIHLDRVWCESVPICIGDAEMRTFSPLHQIIFLCMHALNHSFHPLLRLCDINELVRSEKDKIDWDRLISEAFSLNLSKSVYYVFYLISRMFGTDIPESVLHRLKPRRLGMIERTFLSSVLAGKPILTGEWLLCFGMNDTLRDRFLFLWKLLFPPQTELAIIRKKDDAKAGLPDYITRVGAGISCAVRVMLNFSRQVSFRL